MNTLYMWRAWSEKRDRICDCGTAWATSPDNAVAIAWRCIGGPHMTLIETITVEVVNAPQMPLTPITWPQE